MVGVGTANPKSGYSQEDILRRYGIEDRRVRSLFHNSRIDQRYLHLPAVDPAGGPVTETQGQLLDKHRTEGLELATSTLNIQLLVIGI